MAAYLFYAGQFVEERDSRFSNIDPKTIEDGSYVYFTLTTMWAIKEHGMLKPYFFEDVPKPIRLMAALLNGGI